ncbi:MAG: hypothetical protein HDT40_08905 [Lachnospiraceae bacterium]|nr:hypothetical protein [Lachnospiraceae bacterium]
MPFIDSKVTTEVTKEQQQQLQDMLIAAAGDILGKSEGWVMLGFEPEYTIYFRGDDKTPAAFVEVSIYGSENRQAFSAFTGKICDAFNKVLGISPDRVYVKYYATSSWGWNGSNF